MLLQFILSIFLRLALSTVSFIPTESADLIWFIFLNLSVDLLDPFIVPSSISFSVLSKFFKLKRILVCSIKLSKPNFLDNAFASSTWCWLCSNTRNFHSALPPAFINAWALSIILSKSVKTLYMD